MKYIHSPIRLLRPLLFATIIFALESGPLPRISAAPTNDNSTASSATATANFSRNLSAAPAILPGVGLAQHNFFYAGESKAERMYIVRGGQIVWDYTHPGKGEISDAVLQPNGNILFAHQFSVTEISADKKVLWNYDAPPKTEIHTAQPIGTNSIWFIQNGNASSLLAVGK